MDKGIRWLLGIAALVFLVNFTALILYSDTLRSTHLFITRSTVFYPLAYLNLAVGLVLLFRLVLDILKKRG